jgi:serine/threonine protein kinase
MKWVQGDRLDRHLERPASLGDRLRLFLRIAEAVSFAHAQGVIHRDLKPENVMVGAFGEVLVLDWGLARVLDGAAEPEPDQRTGESAVLGTPGFMAPEQRSGHSATADARADVYSLGALLRWLASAGPPAGQPRPDAGPSSALASIWGKALAQRPDDRYPDVASLSADVARFLDGEAVSAHAESALHRLLRVGRRHRVALGVVAAYLAGRALIYLLTGR